MRVAFYTLGCKVNQRETGSLMALFQAAGYTVVAENDAADVYVVNSCTVTAGGDARSRQWLRRARRQNPTAVCVLTGCFPQAFPAEAQVPEADVITGTVARARLVENVARFLRTGQQVVDIAQHQKDEAFEELPTALHAGRTRAFVKIQDGCDRRCAYCIIPTARGPVRSRTEADILAELATLAQNGYREVIFTGINLPSYGRDTGTDLAAIVEKAAEIKGIERIRLSSLDPDRVTPAMAARFAGVGKLCHQFHLSLQSGCDATLARMRRPYTSAMYQKAADALRSAMPSATFTTDVIVGFPGETGQDHAESLAFVTRLGFLKVHVFPFSPRPGTPAATFPGQVPNTVKAARAKELQTKADAVREDLIRSLEGTKQTVLLEKPLEDGRFPAYTSGYIPVVLSAPGHHRGELVEVTLGPYDGQRCAATLIRPI